MRLLTVAALAASLLSLSVSAMADGSAPAKNSSLTRHVSADVYPSFLTTADTPSYKTKAEVALYWDDAIVRQKNIESVSHPSTGIFCIVTVAAVKLDPSAIYPVVTIDWGDSSGNSLFAYVYGGHKDCHTGKDHTLEVTTYSLVGSTPSLSNSVAFYLTVQ